MKAIILSLFLLSTVSFKSQILYIKEVPDINSKIMKGINKMRDSLGLKPLKESTEMDSAAKHHAYYVAYDLMYRKYPKHDEIDDIPNFTEKLKIKDRGEKGEIMAYPGISFKEIDLESKTYDQIVDKCILDSKNYFQIYDLSQEVIDLYRESKPHYEIIKDEIGEGYYGSFTMFVLVKTPFYKTPMFYTINVIGFK